MTTGWVTLGEGENATKIPNRRRHQRVPINILGRFMLEDRKEHPCQIVNMSPGGMAIITAITGQDGERIVAYLDHIGRVEGKISRQLEGGFAVELRNTPRKREKMASVLTWLTNRDKLNLPEDRRHERFVPKKPQTKITLADGTVIECRLIDVSLSGAAVSTESKPAIGEGIGIGKMRARVVRHIEGGIAVEFAVIQNRDLLEQHITGED